MLTATRELLDRYSGTPRAVTWRWESTAVDVVLRHGSRTDAQALIGAFLADPEARRAVVPVLARHGDLSMAEQLLATCTEAGRLRAGVPADVLHAVGFLGYEPAERLLWEHVEEPDPAGILPTSGVPEASLGLLHLSCRGVRDEIGQALERHVGAGLFPEFLPVLATKTGDPSWLGRLVEWGDGAASTDCNGGLILGVALHGDRARAEFTRLLWNPWWEAYGGGTGSNRWAYAGARVLGLSLSELYDDLVVRLTSDAVEAKEKWHCVATFAALLDHWVDRPWLGLRAAPDPTETCDALYDLLFEWPTPHRDDSLTGLAHKVLDRDDHLLTELYQLRDGLRVRAGYEMEMRTVAHR